MLVKRIQIVASAPALLKLYVILRLINKENVL